MANILLDYMFPIESIEPTPEASTAFLKQVCVLVDPVSVTAISGTLYTKTSQAAVVSMGLSAGATAEIAELFSAGLSKVFILPLSALTGLDEAVEGHEADFYTILVSSDFSDSDVTGMTPGTFVGVIGASSTDDSFLATQAAIANRSAWHTTSSNKAKNMFYAFGKMLSNALAWRNQQYITMPVADDVATLGDADTYFDDKINFVISDDEYGNRLGLFVAGGKAIVSPYIKRNLQIDMQSSALAYISGNQPAYTKTQAALLEDELQKVIQEYIDDKSIDDGEVEVTIVEDNFVANGAINIAEPGALWRIQAEMRATL